MILEKLEIDFTKNLPIDNYLIVIKKKYCDEFFRKGI